MEFDQLSEIPDDQLVVLGKSLCLCQHFETICKSLLIQVGLAEAIQDHAVTTTEDRMLDWDRDSWVNLLLGRGINRLRDKLRVTDGDFTILEKARESRNYVAHESATTVFYVSRHELPNTNLPCLYEHILNVAAGDNLLSAWLYEICEIEHAPTVFMSVYVNSVTAWIFANIEREDYAINDADDNG